MNNDIPHNTHEIQGLNINNQENDISFAYILQDLNNADNHQKQDKDFNNISISLDYNNLDLKGQNNDMFFNSDGYIEEEDDDQFTPNEEEMIKQDETISADQIKHILSNSKYKNQKLKLVLKIKL